MTVQTEAWSKFGCICVSNPKINVCTTLWLVTALSVVFICVDCFLSVGDKLSLTPKMSLPLPTPSVSLSHGFKSNRCHTLR